jgi:hypothetical protein
MEAITINKTYENLNYNTNGLLSNRYSLPHFGRIELKREVALIHDNPKFSKTYFITRARQSKISCLRIRIKWFSFLAHQAGATYFRDGSATSAPVIFLHSASLHN